MNTQVEFPVELSRKEIIHLSAADSIFYCRQFFPKTFRLTSPEYHRDFWFNFESPEKDFFGAEIFRDGGKTTLSRAGISKRIAFGISRTILCVCINETMATHTVRWVKKQIENQTYWATFWNVRKGDKWSDDWIEVINATFDMRINLVAKGMTSGLRGLNLDDYRPDFIFCDDISNEETTGTEDQRVKNSELFFGSLVPALAPKAESPMRKLVLAQTGLHKDDIINKAHKDSTFFTVKYPKLLVDEKTGELKSAWPERFPLDTVLKEKEAYTRRNQTHVWLREFGCKITSRETNPLQPEWRRQWLSLPTNLRYFVGLDPAASKRTTAHRTAVGVVGLDPTAGDVYLIGYMSQQGKNPDEMWTWLLHIYRTLRPRKIGVETIAFQKFLAWYFKQKMQEAKTFFPIEEIEDKRSKPDRIIQAFGLGSQGKFWTNENHTEFNSQFDEWTEDVDWDLGDAVAQAITLANPWLAQSDTQTDPIEGEYGYEEEEKGIPELVFEGGAP